MTGCTRCCARYFITFDGQECQPIPIDGIIWMKDNHQIYRPNSFGGYCETKNNGTVTVALNIGKCSSYPSGNTYTGFDSATRIIIEEVEPSQT